MLPTEGLRHQSAWNNNNFFQPSKTPKKLKGNQKNTKKDPPPKKKKKKKTPQKNTKPPENPEQTPKTLVPLSPHKTKTSVLAAGQTDQSTAEAKMSRKQSRAFVKSLQQQNLYPLECKDYGFCMFIAVFLLEKAWFSEELLNKNNRNNRNDRNNNRNRSSVKQVAGSLAPMPSWSAAEHSPPEGPPSNWKGLIQWTRRVPLCIKPAQKNLPLRGSGTHDGCK